MKNELKNALKPLYEELSQIDPKQKYETFCMQWGKNYKKGGILFVGRAVRGWKTKGNRDCTGFFDEAPRQNSNQIFALPNQMQWVEDKNYTSSPFWDVIKRVTQEIYKCNEGWSSYIAWSDLYKLARLSSNPSDSLCDKQYDICFKILKTELDILQPKVVVFLTGKNWYADFLRSLNGGYDPQLTDSCKIEETNFSIETYCINNIFYIGSIHPQGRGKPRQPQIEGILAAIKKAK